MSESEQEFVSFATKFSKKALAALQTLPAPAQQALSDVLAALAEDPNKFPHRNRLNPRDGKSFLYSHPEPLLEVTYELDKERQIIYFLHFAAPALQQRKPLFISYSHLDATWLDELLKWLKTIQRQGLIDIWDDRKIKPGAKWQDEIEQALRSAKAAVLLVSPNFLASDFILDVEMPALLEAAKGGQLQLLWIAVSDSPVEDTPLKNDQALNDPARPLDALEGAKRNEAFHRIYDGIKQALTS